MAGSSQELKQTWIKSRNILFSPVFTFGLQWPTEALRRRCLLCCAHWQIRQKEGALKLFYLQITHLFNNYITNYVSLFIFKATPLLKGSRKQGLTCLSTMWSKKSRISWMETVHFMLKVESHGWKSYYYWLGDGNVLLNYHPATSKGFFCHVTLHTEQPPSLQWANSDWQKKAEFHQTQTLQHWLRNGYCAQIQFQKPFPLLLLQLSSNRLEKGNMAHKKILQEFINKTQDCAENESVKAVRVLLLAFPHQLVSEYPRVLMHR